MPEKIKMTGDSSAPVQSFKTTTQTSLTAEILHRVDVMTLLQLFLLLKVRKKWWLCGEWSSSWRLCALRTMSWWKTLHMRGKSSNTLRPFHSKPWSFLVSPWKKPCATVISFAKAMRKTQFPVMWARKNLISPPKKESIILKEHLIRKLLVVKSEK